MSELLLTCVVSLQPYPPSDVNSTLPPVASFHRSANTSTSFVTTSHTPPLNTSEGLMGHRGTTGGGSQTGDALGKALASVSWKADAAHPPGARQACARWS
ncbi:hypothetical protein scyTo_0022246 [Scyliorhinus torazame]|uniref:Uncharacterized protein n=1 Tax=Scyliorhinus torazame TaxID=75743 RepID=A0A401Q960_SCYTO|nr:hypothetical protein [Scyliorhinus torazame]